MNKKIKAALQVMKTFKFNSSINYFRDYFGLLNKPIVYNFKNGIKIMLRGGTVDRVALNEIFFYNLYTPKGYEINKGDLVLDVGGHIGLFSIFASQFASKVFTFEPMFENFQMLQQNLELNNNKKVIPFKVALSDKEGERDLFLSEGEQTGGHSFYNVTHVDNPRKAIVETISLDKFVKDNDIKQIDFLKLDCEGGEYEILFGCSEETLNKIKKMAIEYHNIDEAKNPKILKDFLLKKGYEIEVDEVWGYIYAKK